MSLDKKINDLHNIGFLDWLKRKTARAAAGVALALTLTYGTGCDTPERIYHAAVEYVQKTVGGEHTAPPVPGDAQRTTPTPTPQPNPQVADRSTTPAPTCYAELEQFQFDSTEFVDSAALQRIQDFVDRMRQEEDNEVTVYIGNSMEDAHDRRAYGRPQVEPRDPLRLGHNDILGDDRGASVEQLIHDVDPAATSPENDEDADESNQEIQVDVVNLGEVDLRGAGISEQELANNRFVYIVGCRAQDHDPDSILREIRASAFGTGREISCGTPVSATPAEQPMNITVPQTVTPNLSSAVTPTIPAPPIARLIPPAPQQVAAPPVQQYHPAVSTHPVARDDHPARRPAVHRTHIYQPAPRPEVHTPLPTPDDNGDYLIEGRRIRLLPSTLPQETPQPAMNRTELRLPDSIALDPGQELIPSPALIESGEAPYWHSMIRSDDPTPTRTVPEAGVRHKSEYKRESLEDRAGIHGYELTGRELMMIYRLDRYRA